MEKYTIGVDFGTLSARAVVAGVRDGRVLGASTSEYPHGVLERALPDGTPLPEGWALQDPRDYITALCACVPAAVRAAGVKAEDVIGIGTDFTASTPLPVTREGTPLCLLDGGEHAPHAYARLWKHHAAQPYAQRMTEGARGAEWLARFGGSVSCEGALPKLWQALEEAPALLAQAGHWIEAGDWIVWQLTGRAVRGLCGAGFKSYWQAADPAWFDALDARFGRAVREKCALPVQAQGTAAGGLTEEMARRLQLRAGTPVAVGNVDAHACLPAAGICQSGQMLAILGTSACYITHARQLCAVPGISGAVKDAVLPGLWAYEAGQSCVGDLLAWFAASCVPEEIQAEAARRGESVQQRLTALAARLRPGQSGLLALDWWNGNRSILGDSTLSGLMLGMTLQTRPEEIYRALLEATAFGARMIVENDREHGVAVDEILALGGISQKNALAMQIYADVLNMPLQVVRASEGGALGSAIWGAVAAGKARGGYDDVYAAIAAMGCRERTVYRPDAHGVAVYERLFREYRALHDYFGRGGSEAMRRLRALRGEKRE